MVHVWIQSYRWRKRHQLGVKYPPLSVFEICVLALLVPCGGLLFVVFWPINLALYKFDLQDELNESRGILTNAGLL